MAVSRLSQQSLQNAFPKGNTIWDGTTATSAFDTLGTVLLSSTASSITFSNIPQTYSHLQIRAYAPTGQYMEIRFNGDTTTSNYRGHYVVGTGGGTTPGAGTNANNAYFPETGGWSSPWSGVLDILDYSNTNKYKTQRLLEGYDGNGTGEVYLYSSLWMSTAAISSVTLARSGVSFSQNSQFSLYGIK